MTRQPNFSGVWIKIERANEHISNLETLVERFKQTNPYKVLSYCALDTGDLVFEVKAFDQPPLWWSAVVGDAIHNLRSSLDLLVCEMVRANGKPVTDKTGCPVAKSSDAFKSGYLGKVKGAPQEAINLIKAANPYKGANDAFWRLHQLDIVDKHKLLVPVGMAPEMIVHDLSAILAGNPDLANKMTSPQQLITPSDDVTVARRRVPLKDGARQRARRSDNANVHVPAVRV